MFFHIITMTTEAPRKYKFTLKKPIHTSTDTKCSICLDDVRFPMSNGCCSYKFCKSCFDIMPQNHKSKCGGCRQNTVFSTITSTRPNRDIRHRNLINELNDRITDIEARNEARIQSYEARIQSKEACIQSYEVLIRLNARIQSADRCMLITGIVVIIFQYIYNRLL